MNEYFLRMNKEELEEILIKEIENFKNSDASSSILYKLVPNNFEEFSLTFKLKFKSIYED